MPELCEASSVWDSGIVRCKLCQTPGCKYRAIPSSAVSCNPTSGYCCKKCEDHGKHCSGDDGAKASETVLSDGLHDACCARLDEEVLRACWWETLRCDAAYEEDAACFVAPPMPGASARELSKPSPVLLFLTGNGHVDDRQDFLDGGPDVLLRNPAIRENFFLIAPKPTSNSGLLRYNESWKRTWSEEAVWALFTEVLRRLGPAKVDPGRLFVTGLSLGAAGTWHVALRYGEFLAGVVPISGGCEWPEGTWRGSGPEPEVMARLAGLPLRAYQIDCDLRAGTPIQDMEWLCYDAVECTRDLTLAGMDAGKTCDVRVREWNRHDTGTKWDLWLPAGPMQDWSFWDDWGGDKHCLWYRVYTLPDWGIHDFLQEHSLPQDRQWRFDSAPLKVDTSEAKARLEAAWAAHSSNAADNADNEHDPKRARMETEVDSQEQGAAVATASEMDVIQ